MKYRIADDVVLRQVNDELIVLNTQTEEYFGLDTIGLRVWELVTTGSDTPGCAAVLADEFDAHSSVIENDVRELIGQLMEAGLILPEE